MPTRRRFWLAVAIQVAVLLAMIAVHGFTLATGRAVTLKTRPIDPWSLMSGRYVALSYDISGLTEGQVPMTGGPYKRGQTVWVTLQKGDPYWQAVALSDRRPAVGPDQVALRGMVSSDWQPVPFVAGEPARPWQYVIQYGIEQFYIPEGETAIERRGAEFTVEALVDSTGRAALHRVFLDGKQLNWR